MVKHKLIERRLEEFEIVRYELCPYFRDCDREAVHKCIGDYEVCDKYKHKQGELKNGR